MEAVAHEVTEAVAHDAVLVLRLRQFRNCHRRRRCRRFQLRAFQHCQGHQAGRLRARLRRQWSHFRALVYQAVRVGRQCCRPVAAARHSQRRLSRDRPVQLTRQYRQLFLTKRVKSRISDHRPCPST